MAERSRASWAGIAGVGALLLAAGVAGAGQSIFTGWDCAPDACVLDADTLQVCEQGTQRLVGAPIEPRLTVISMTWKPGGVPAEGKSLAFVFRDGAALDHRVTFDVAGGKIVMGGGLPGGEVSFAFANQFYFVEVIHGHNLIVYIDGVRVVREPLAEADWTATSHVLEAVDDGTCHFIQEIWGNDFRWDCVGNGTCTLDADGMALCSPHEVAAELATGTGDGIFTIDWTPDTAVRPVLTVTLRDGQANDHVIVLAASGDRIGFGGGLVGATVGFDFGAGIHSISIRHPANEVAGTLELHIDGQLVGAATYAPIETATNLGLVAQNMGGCQRVTYVATP